MGDILSSKNSVPCRLIWLLILLALAAPRTAGAATLDSRYPGLSMGLLKSAELAPLDEDTLLVSEGFTITRSLLLEGIKNQDPELRAQMEKNLIFLLEQEAVRRVLNSEARKAGLADDGDDNRLIQALFEYRTRDLTVSEDKALDFYKSNAVSMALSVWDWPMACFRVPAPSGLSHRFWPLSRYSRGLWPVR